MRPAGVNLTLTNGRDSPELMVCLFAVKASSTSCQETVLQEVRRSGGIFWRHRLQTSWPPEPSADALNSEISSARVASHLEREPVRDDLRAGVAIERLQRAVDRRERVAACGRRRTPAAAARAAASGRALASARSSARESSTPRSRSIDATSRSRRAKLVAIDLVAAQRPRRRQPLRRRRLPAPPASTSLRPRRAPRRRPRCRPRARGRCCRRPPPRPHALRAPRSRDRASAPPPSPPGESGPNRRRWQRDRTVGSSTSGRDGHQHERRRRRRLLERLQQRVLRRRLHRVRLVDDHDAAAALERPVGACARWPRAPDRP